MIRCWEDLSTERQIGMAEGPIPWSAILRWCEWHELDREATGIMMHVIRSLDVDRARARAADVAAKRALGPSAPRGR